MKLEDIKRNFLDEIPSKYEKRKGTFLWDIVKAISIRISEVYDSLNSVKSELDIDNLEGNKLEKYINQRTAIERKKATYSTGILNIKGNGAIKRGDLFETDGYLQFESIEDKRIKGEDKVLIKAKNTGTEGNVIAGSITKMPITIQGITGCINEKETTGGYDEESDLDLKTRYFEHLRTPATSGNIYHYLKWAKEVEGVGLAKIYPLWDGNNTVKIVIIDNNRKPASESLVEKVQEYIDPESEGKGEGRAPIGAFCTVVSADAIRINISVKLTIIDGADPGNIKTKIEDEINNYLASIAFSSTLLSYSIVGARILNVAGILRYEELKINGTINENLTCNESEVFLLNEVILVE